MRRWKEPLHAVFKDALLPSEAIQILAAIKGSAITKFTRLLSLGKTDAERYSYDPEKYANLIASSEKSRLEHFLKRAKISKTQLFELGHGPLILQTDNANVVISESTATQSIILWEDTIDNVRSLIEALSYECIEVYDHDSQFMISSFGDLFGCTITNIGFYRLDKSTSIPNEQGLIIETDRGQKLIISYRIAQSPNRPLSVITNEQIDPELRLIYSEI